MNPTDNHTDNPRENPQRIQEPSPGTPQDSSTENSQNRSQGIPQNTSQDNLQNHPIENSQNSPQDIPQEHSQGDTQNRSMNNPLDHSQGDTQNRSMNNPLDHSPDDTQNRSMSNPLDHSPDDTQNRLLNNPLDHSPGDSQNRPMNNPLDHSPENQQNPHADTLQNSSPEMQGTVSESTGKRSARKIALYTAAAAAVILLLAYLGISNYFRSHFLFHTTINGQDFSQQTVEDARTFFADKAAAYTLKITESGGKSEEISGSEIKMVWEDNQALDHILKNQNAFAWPMEYFKEKSEDIDFDISYDKSALEKKVHSLDAVTAEPVPPQSAYPEFDGNSYVIRPEIYGTDLDAEKLLEKIHDYVGQLEEEIDLQEEGFYKMPEYTSDSEKLKEVCQTLNHYCQASITYEMEVPVVVDKTLISTWLSFDKDFHVTLDEAAVRNWTAEFGRRYDTVGTTRPLTTPTGKQTEVSGGTYGWIINEDEEFPALLNSIKNGEVVTKAPACLQTAASHSPQDWGSTFLEVDLTTQHMWYVQNDAVVFESDVVTGKNSTITPPGVYTILEKLSPTVLVGNIDPETQKPEYRTPVTFWMRVTWSGIGFHDATWQPAFGGDVYLWNGSHGCINMPYYGAQELYSLIQIGVPVVIHY